MPSFDIVSEVDKQEVRNAVDQVNKEISTRFDFKGSDARVEQTELQLTVFADDDFKLEQILDILRTKLTKRTIDVRCLDKGQIEKISGNKIKQLNTKGFEIRGQVDKMLSFYTFFTSEQAFYPGFITDEIQVSKGIPGAGYYKDFKTGGYDYFRAKGYVAFTPSKYISFQFGNDKNFIGDGYRTLFLSDDGANYFYLKLNTKLWIFDYQNIFLYFQNFIPLKRLINILNILKETNLTKILRGGKR
mgnify:CR=1 FL=1